MHMQLRDSEVSHACKHHSEFFFVDEAELLAYVRDMHGKLYMIRQDDFKPLNYFLLVKAT